MFPPGNAPASVAITEHLQHKRSPYAGLVGPLLVSAQRWEEFLDAHAAAGSPPLAVTVVGSSREPQHLPAALDLVGFEVPVTGTPLPVVAASRRLACEMPGQDRSELLAAVAEQRAKGRDVIGKFRTGGTIADAFPSVDTAAEVLVISATVRAPLKFTAGLHSAVRCTDPSTGFEHHGFLNLMHGSLLARQGADAGTVADVLTVRNEDAVTNEVDSWSTAEAAVVREEFVSFGCCGVEDPVHELVRLGLLEMEAS